MLRVSVVEIPLPQKETTEPLSTQRIQNGEITIAYYSVLICVIRVNLWLSGLEFSLAHLVKTHVGDAFTLMRREVLDIS